ncbi:OB-fold domain-containing protein [Microbacterium abyssi]|uniref:OB-fold domain-containing protein n=1 Tax=Microbacterium abyssi TaxID=2782166 RepID=UPI001886F910|nr:OB-fold domain-containing protein [Microbacterium sp. A18JL241]
MDTQTSDAGDLSAYIGREAEPPRVSRFEVNEAMIVHWTEALEDRNPLYADRDAARAAGRATTVCPPAMISTWVMSGYQRYRAVQQRRKAGEAEATEYSALMRELDDLGFTSVVGTDVEQHYTAEVPVGTRVTARYTIEDVSPLKKTKLGDGHFVTLHKRYDDEDGRELATERFRLLRFRPASAPRADRRSGVPPLVRTQDNGFWFDAAAKGRLVIQRCTDCGELRHPPGPSCPHCRSFSWDAVESTGRGTLHSWTIVHHPQDPAFTYPLAVGLLDLDEGIRIVADFESVPESGLEIGAAAHIVFGEHEHGEQLPFVRLGEPDVVPAAAHVEPAVEECQGGTVLPALSLELDRTAIIAAALASQDYEDVHHDPSRARQRGMPDIFLSINTTNGLVSRYLTDWGGPQLRIHSIALRLGVPHFAGMQLRLTGLARSTEDGRTEVEVVGRNDAGVHVRATAVVSGTPGETE